MNYDLKMWYLWIIPFSKKWSKIVFFILMVKNCFIDDFAIYQFDRMR